MPTVVPPRKGYESSGTYNPFPLSDDDFNHLSDLLSEKLNEEVRDQLQDAGAMFLLNSSLYASLVLPTEVKAACRGIINKGGKIKQILQDLDDVSLVKIASSHERISAVEMLDIRDRLLTDLDAFIVAAGRWKEQHEQFKNKPSKPKGGAKKKHTALIELVKDLIPIFEVVTNKKATSYYSETYKTESLFFAFTNEFVHIIQSKFINDNVIAKVIQKALSSN